jgi:two-component system, LytTR family, response regulator
MKAIAIDDEPIALEIIRSHASKVPFIELKEVFTNALSAMEYLQKEPVDLLFLDIKMPDISGIEFYNSLNRRPLVIFTTAYSEHAAIGFELDAVDYLLKPFSFARFLKGCNKAQELYHSRNSSVKADHVFLKTGYEQVKVLFEDILYLEAAGNYVSFVVKDKPPVLSRSTFLEVWNALPEYKFVRVHRSYVVAINKIEKVERHQVSIAGKKIPVSEGYYGELVRRLKGKGWNGGEVVEKLKG